MPRPAPKPRRNPLLPFYVILGVAALAGAFFLFRQMGGGGGTPATTLQPVADVGRAAAAGARHQQGAARTRRW